VPLLSWGMCSAVARAGRPSKLTEETKKLLNNITAGAPYEIACTAAGITYRTFRRWMRKGEHAKSGEFFQFFHAVEEANAQAAVRLLGAMQKAINEGNVGSAQFILERRFKKYFAQRSEQQVLGADGGPLELTLVWKDTVPLHNEREDTHDTKEDPRR